MFKFFGRKNERLDAPTIAYKQPEDDAQLEAPETLVALKPSGVYFGRIKDAKLELHVEYLSANGDRKELQQAMREANQVLFARLLKAEGTSLEELIIAGQTDPTLNDPSKGRAHIGSFTVEAMSHPSVEKAAFEALAYNEAMHKQERDQASKSGDTKQSA